MPRQEDGIGFILFYHENKLFFISLFQFYLLNFMHQGRKGRESISSGRAAGRVVCASCETEPKLEPEKILFHFQITCFFCRCILFRPFVYN